jgi:ABC-type Fe3+-hydroxamate transport system substrate-binding protein
MTAASSLKQNTPNFSKILALFPDLAFTNWLYNSDVKI